MPVNEPSDSTDNTPSPLKQTPLAPASPKGALRIIFIIVFADLMGFGVIIPLLPIYARTFDASNLQVTLLFSVFSLCQLVASPVLGTLSDKYGRRPVLILSQLGSAFGYVILALATEVEWASPFVGLMLLYVSRVIDGASGGNISTAQAYVSDVTTPANRAKGMGVIGAAFGIGFAVGPALGGVLGHYNVSWPAWAAATFCTVAAVLTYLKLPESRWLKGVSAKPQADGETGSWWNPARLKPLVRNRPLMQLQCIWFLSMTAFVMLEAVFAIFLVDRFNYGTVEIGWFFAYVGVIIAIVQGGLIGRLTKRFGEWPLTIAGPLLVTVAMLGYVEVGREVAWAGLALLLVCGLFNATGRSLQTPTLSSLVSKFSPEDQQGVVFGLYHGLGSLARVVGPVGAGLLYDRHHSAPFMVAGIITLGAAVWTIGLRMSLGARARQFDTGTFPPKTVPET